MSQSNVYELLKKAQEINDEFDRVHKHMAAMLDRIQAAVDEIMLEYCPEEMTTEQSEEWWRCQVPVKETGLKEADVLDAMLHEGVPRPVATRVIEILKEAGR